MDGGEWSPLSPHIHSSHYMGGWAGHRAEMDVSEETKIPCPGEKIIPNAGQVEYISRSHA